MNFMTWFPAVSVTAVFAAVLYFARDLILASATKGVQHNFDQKLEALRAEFRKNEESFKSDLRSKEAQITALREGALTGLASRRAALDQRRLQAVERIWSAVVSVGILKLASTYMSVINFDVATKEIPKSPNARKMFETLGKSIDLSKVSTIDAARERPFVSPTAWALFSAYQAILFYAAMQMKTLELGFDASKFLTNAKIDALIKAALPHYSNYVEEHGAAGYHYLLDDLEQKLLDELRNMLDGTEVDTASVADAARIVRAAELVQAEIGASSI